jgi:hypothetical protein
MSVDIRWHQFDDSLAEDLRRFLNKFLSSAKYPDFIGKIVIESLNFGDEPPYIEIKDICDPFPEFYDQEEDVNDIVDDDEEDSQTYDKPSLGPWDSASRAEGFPVDQPKISSSINRNVEDVQLEVFFSYSGNLKITICTELVINQPVPNFLTLPMQMTLTHLSLQGILSFQF